MRLFDSVNLETEKKKLNETLFVVRHSSASELTTVTIFRLKSIDWFSDISQKKKKNLV